MNDGVCLFCKGSLKDGSCIECGSITLKRKIKKRKYNDFNEHSYNWYREKRHILPKIYFFWIKIKIYILTNSNIWAKVLGFILRPFLGLIPLALSKHRSFLDVGCGRGDFMKFLPKNWDVNGCDILNYDLKQKNIAVGDFEGLDFKKKYDMVYSSHSIEHSLNPRKFLEKMIKVTKRNGFIIILTPNSESLANKIFKKNWWILKIQSHFCILSMPAVVSFLRENNCRILYKNTYTVFSVAGSVINMLNLNTKNTPLLFIFIILFAPLTFLELILNKADSFVIYAQKNKD